MTGTGEHRQRPVVGITAYAEHAAWGAWEATAALVPFAYVRAVERAGGRPLLIPPSSEGIGETLDAVSALVLSGGSDLDPSVYRAEPHPETNGIRPERDRAELALLEAALARDMPVLAVCRGMQVLNVLRGGNLVQHLPELIGHENHRQVVGVFSEHEVTVKPGSRLAGILGERARIKSHHHQGTGKVGRGLDVVAWADDGTIEGLEAPAHRFALGVLWHPEEDDGVELFEALVVEAHTYRARQT